MMGFPAASAPYLVGMMLITTIAAESICDLVTQLVSSTPAAIILAQGVLVVLCVFVDAAFIQSTHAASNFWVWLQKLSFFWWSSKGINANLYNHIDYSCSASSVSNGGCSFNGNQYPCDTMNGDGSCKVTGDAILFSRSNYHADNYNQMVPAIIVLSLGARILTYLFQQFHGTYIRSINRIRSWIKFSNHHSSKGSAATGIHYPNAVEMKPLQHSAIEVKEAEAFSDTFGSSSTRLIWSKIRLTLKSNQKVLVDDINGHAVCGRMLAILGGSGAG
jgi:hypothetical protein